MTREDILLAKSGNEEAIERIFSNYKSYIVRNSQNFYLKDGERDDLEQEGYIGLLKAIKYYDENRHIDFDIFVYLCVKRQMFTAIRNSNTLKSKSLTNAILMNKQVIFEDLNSNKKSFEFYSPEDIVLGKELILSLKKYLIQKLTCFEKDVFYYMIKGYTYTQIANKLLEKPKKIDNTIQRIKRKINKFMEEYRNL